MSQDAVTHAHPVVRTHPETGRLSLFVNGNYVRHFEGWTEAESAPLLQDGFVNREEMRALVKAGAVGEVTGWAFDRQGHLIDGLTNDRVASVALDRPARRLIIGAAMGGAKVPAIAAALAGRIINGLITNETTAHRLLKS